jgi:hypothetical protein
VRALPRDRFWWLIVALALGDNELRSLALAPALVARDIRPEFPDVRNFGGSISEWANEGRPLVPGDGSPAIKSAG